MKIGLLRNLLETAGLLLMFEDKSDCRRQIKGQRSTDEPDLQIEIDPSTDEIEDEY
jgi:hypothetical protein